MRQKIKLLALCKTSRSRRAVLGALKERKCSCTAVTLNALSDFMTRAREERFDVGLLEYASLPVEAAKHVRLLKRLGKQLPLILLVAGREEERALCLLEKGVISDYVVKSARGMKRLSSVLLMVTGRSRGSGADVPSLISNETVARLIENSMVGIARTTPDGRILFANQALVQLLGYDSFEELQTRNLQQEGFTESHPRSEFLELVNAAGEIRGYESVWKRKDGTFIHVRENARVVRGADGRVLYYDDVIENITEQKQASLSLQEKVAALQTLTDVDRDILAAHQREDILELVCRSAASLLKTPMAAIVSTRDAKWSVKTTFGVQHPDELKREWGKVNSMASREALADAVLDDISVAPPAILKPLVREGVCSLLTAMLTIGAREEGILLVMDTRPRTWTKEDHALLKVLAGRASSALEKAHLLMDAQRRGDEFAALHQVSVDLSRRQGLQSVLSKIVDSVSQIMHVPSAFIYLYDPKRERLDLSISKGMEYSKKLSVKLGEGLAGRVAQRREAAVIKNYRKWAHRLKALDEIGYSSVLEVPMLFGGMLIGVLGVAEIMNATRQFTEQDEQLLSLFAAQAASAVHNENLFEATQQSNRELNRLYRALGALIGAFSPNIEDICRRIAQIVVTEFSQSNCSVWLVSGDPPSLRRMALAGTTASEIVLRPLSLTGKGLIPKAIRSGQIVNVPDVHADPDYLSGWEAARSELVLPLQHGDTVIGALDLQSAEPSAFHEDEVRVLSQFASRASLMVEYARLASETEQRLQRLSVLHTVDIAVASSLDLQVTMKVFLEQVTSQLHVDAADVLLLNPYLQILEFAAGRGFRETGIRRVSLRLGEDAAGQAALERVMVGLSRIDGADAQVSHPERIAGEGFVSMYAVPLIARGKLKGVMELWFRSPFHADLEWQTFVETLARQAAVSIDDAHLFEQLQQSYTELTVAYDSTIEGWAKLLELRNVEPQGHTRRVAALVVELARRLNVPEQELKHIHRGAILHDIGKLAIPEQILLKPSKLTEEEMAAIRTHPVIARDLLTSIDYLRPAAVIPYGHHERWDGHGYPNGLAGEQIPLAARIFSVVDVWDTLLCRQSYRSAWCETDVLKYIRAQSGIEFDPRVVNAFFALLQEGNKGIVSDNYDTI